MLIGRLFMIGVALVSVAAHLTAQTTRRDAAPPTDRSQARNTARMSGRVIASDTGKPLRNAAVAILRPEADPLDPEARRASTDDQGWWQITVPPGKYRVSVSKPGYVRLDFGQRRAIDPAAVVDVAEGAHIDRLDVTLPRAGAIGGRIGDENGDPVTPALVTVQRVRYVDGVPTLKPVAEGVITFLSGGLTDDRGEYRIHSLGAGTYYVSAHTAPTPGPLAREGAQLAPTFYPGTPSLSEAQPVTIAAGEESLSISFNLTRVRVARISGVVRTTAGGLGLPNVELRSTSPIPAYRHTVTDKSGAFSIADVPPGDYRLAVTVWPRDDRAPEIASVPLTIAGEDLLDLVVATSTTTMVAGRVVTDNGEPLPAGIWIDVVGARADILSPPQASRTSVRKDGTFLLRGVLDAHLIRAEASGGWFLKSAMLNGRDLADVPYEFKTGEQHSDLELTLTRQRTILRGTVTDDANVASTSYAVVAFSTDDQRWGRKTRHVQAIAPRPTGDFSIEGLPPGEYFVIALEYLESGEESSVERLERWKAGANRITLADGEAASLSLKLKR